VLYAYVKKRGLEQASHGLYVTRYVDRESLKYTIPEHHLHSINLRPNQIASSDF